MIWTNVLRYEDGILYWLIKPSQKVSIGDEAGTIVDGYVKVMYKKKSTGAHQIVWEIHNGAIPEGMEIDHENHIRSDNRIENLRLVSIGQNALNKSMYSNNKSGVTGVSWHSKRKKWIAQMQVDGVKKMLYEGDSLDEAIKARVSFQNKTNAHKNHGVKNECK